MFSVCGSIIRMFSHSNEIAGLGHMISRRTNTFIYSLAYFVCLYVVCLVCQFLYAF